MYVCVCVCVCIYICVCVFNLDAKEVDNDEEVVEDFVINRLSPQLRNDANAGDAHAAVSVRGIGEEKMRRIINREDND